MQSLGACSPTVATVHGLELTTPFEIWPGGANVSREWSHRLSVEVIEEGPTAPRLTGVLLAESIDGGERMYTFTRSGTRIEFSFPDLCWGWLDVELGHIELRSSEPEVAALVLPNTIIAVLLGELGDLTLHGSAVDLGGQTLAFCGPSTAGKTTCAAALCSIGALAVTDDLLRVQTHGKGAPTCFPGIPEFRLRAAHQWNLPPDCLRTLVDERTGFTPRQIAHGKSPLRAVLFPIASLDERPPTLLRLQGHVALRRLLQSSRIAWQPGKGSALLRHMSTLCARLELYELHVRLPLLNRASYREELANVLSHLAQRRP